MAVRETSETSPRRGGALTTYFSILLDPLDAFAALESRPTWAWAFVLSALLIAAAGMLASPAQDHIQQVRPTPLVTVLLKNLAFGPVDAVISCLFVSSMLFVSSVLSKRRVSFVYAWALACNCCLILGIAAAVNGYMIAAKGYDAATTRGDLFVLPSLKFLVSAGSPILRAVLYSYNAFNIWYDVLLAVGFVYVFHVSNRQAIVTVVAITIIGAIVAGTLTAVQTGLIRL
jgi:hypothetical protein